MIKWPQDVVDDVARRKCVIFLGAGISMNSVNAAGRRPKTWLQFLQAQLGAVTPNAHIKKLIKVGDYLTACEVIKKSLGRETFTRIVRDEFLTPAYIASSVHEAIFSLDSRVVVTPNFDKIYESYANANANGSIVVKNHYDDDVCSVIRESGRIILKIHGTIDSPDKMIFTRAEYAEARTKYASFYDLVSALSLTHTFIFLGCGVSDPDIRLLLEDTFFRHNSARSHVMLLSSGTLHNAIIDVVQDTMNLKIIKYSSVDNHRELLESLVGLKDLVERARDELRTNSNW